MESLHLKLPCGGVAGVNECNCLFTSVMVASHFLGCEVLNFDQAMNHRPSSESNWSS
jgi:hypothetical protein